VFVKGFAPQKVWNFGKTSNPAVDFSQAKRYPEIIKI